MTEGVLANIDADRRSCGLTWRRGGSGVGGRRVAPPDARLPIPIFEFRQPQDPY
jgi:hypothetical protein